MKKTFFLVCSIISIHSSFAQKAPLNWYLKHPQKDKIFGVGATEAVSGGDNVTAVSVASGGAPPLIRFLYLKLQWCLFLLFLLFK